MRLCGNFCILTVEHALINACALIVEAKLRLWNTLAHRLKEGFKEHSLHSVSRFSNFAMLPLLGRFLDRRNLGGGLSPQSSVNTLTHSAPLELGEATQTFASMRIRR